MTRFRFYAAMIWLTLAMPLAAGAAVYRIPLKDFLAVDIVHLQGTSDSTEAREDSIPVGSRWQVLRAVLRFDYVCSSALLREASRLNVMINNYPVGQIQLESLAPKGRAEIEIEPARLPPGYNRLVFSVTQHGVRGECEDPTLPELWTRIDLTTAELELDVAPRPVPAQLSSVGTFLFDSRDLIADTVHIVVPEITPAYLKRAGLAAAGAALRREYRPILITLSDRLAADRDNLVIGPLKFLETLGLQGPAGITGAMLGIAPLSLPRGMETQAAGTDPFHAVVYLSGTTDAELDRAARAFSLLSTPFPPEPGVAVREVVEPPLTSYRRQNGVGSGRDYSLASLGFETTTFQGAHPQPRGFSFRLPSDLHIEPNHPLTLSVDLAYGSGMRANSAVNVRVNGKFMAAIPLDNPVGGTYRGYKVQVLSSILRPGINTIRFVPVLTAPVAGGCAPVQEGNLVVTIMEDSSISLPAYAHWVRMPRLQAFMIDGFPFGRWPDLRETAVCLPGGNFEAAAAAVNLVAMISQKIGYPPTEVAWHVGANAAQDRDVVVTGTRKALGTAPFSTWLADSIPLGEAAWIAQPQLSRPTGRKKRLRDWLTPIREWFGRPPEPLPKERLTDVAREKFDGGNPSGWGYLSERSRQENAQRTLLVLTAENENDLLEASRRLWQPAVQAAASGGAIAIRLDPKQPQVLILDSAKTYYLGAVGPFPTLNNYINAHPLRAITLILVLLAVCSLLIFALLRRVRRRRLADA